MVVVPQVAHGTPAIVFFYAIYHEVANQATRLRQSELNRFYFL